MDISRNLLANGTLAQPNDEGHLIIILCLYLVALWAVFSTAAVGLVVRDYLAVSRRVYPRDFLAFFNCLTPPRLPATRA